MRSRLHAPLLAALLLVAWATTVTRRAEAHKNGIQTTTCAGCHRTSGTAMATVTLTPDHTPVMPGETIAFVATITAPNVKDGGIYVEAPEVGMLATSAGQGLTLSDGALTHSTPMTAANGNVAFNFSWQAPSDPGAVKLQVYALAGNGNGQNTGDVPGETSLEFTFGCEPATYYFDADNDGYGGNSMLTKLGCAEGPPPRAYAPTNDDCDEGFATVHPGAPERCNGKDDNCDGNIDENTQPGPLYPDPDGDGFYGNDAGEPVIGCLPMEGYADEPGDCAPSEPGRFPGAVEVCNLKDDDCDGHIDEDVRPRCGIGRCAQESPTCDEADSHEGTPTTEKCNGLDDDCNGVADDGEMMCADGSQCLGLRCVVVDDGSMPVTGNGGSAGMTSLPSGGMGTGGMTASGAMGGTGADPATSNGATGTSSPASPSGLQPAAPASCNVATPRHGSAAMLALGLVVAAGVGRRRRARRS